MKIDKNEPINQKRLTNKNKENNRSHFHFFAKSLLMRIMKILFLLTCFQTSFSQKQDTLHVYFDAGFQQTFKSKATIEGYIVSAQNRWNLNANYMNGRPLLKASFQDRELRIKDGYYVLYYDNGKIANEGKYVNNIREGIWKFYYPSGEIKDSGLVFRGQMTEKWTSWYETGTIKFRASFQSTDSIKTYQTSSITTGKLNNQLPPYFLDGDWISYHANGTIDSKGTYSNNQKEGAWYFYRENGVPSSVELYHLDKIQSMECFDSNGIKTSSYCTLVALPYPMIDRYTDLNTFILDNFVWPTELVEKGLNGQVSGQFTISKTGDFINFKITSSTHKLLSKETERLLRSIKRWIPAVSHNRNIDYTFNFSIPLIKTIDIYE